MAADETTPGGAKAKDLIAGKISQAVIEVKGKLVGEMRLGDTRIVLEQTPLGEVQARFGGELRHSGEAGSAVDWICYRAPASPSGPPMLIWLLSDSEMSGEHGEITGVALEVPVGEPPKACAVLRSGGGLDMGLPTLGVGRHTLSGMFGSAQADEDNLVTYAYTAHAEPDADTGQLLTYKFESGGAVAVEVSQETTH